MELNWMEWNGMEWNWMELSWIELNLIEMKWNELNWIELNWIELNWIELSIRRRITKFDHIFVWSPFSHDRHNKIFMLLSVCYSSIIYTSMYLSSWFFSFHYIYLLLCILFIFIASFIYLLNHSCIIYFIHCLLFMIS